jgi:hypothetical protein
VRSTRRRIYLPEDFRIPVPRGVRWKGFIFDYWSVELGTELIRRNGGICEPSKGEGVSSLSLRTYSKRPSWNSFVPALIELRQGVRRICAL